MLKNSRFRNTLGAGVLIFTCLAGAFTILAPARAQSALKQLASLSCFDNKECIRIINTSPSGKAIVGVAQNAPGIAGYTNVNTNTNPNPNITAFVVNAGVHGVDAATNRIDTNAGVLGTSAHGNGVVGLTTYDTSKNMFGTQGILGFDLSSTISANAGVNGISNHNFGVFALSNDPNGGPAVYGEDTGGLGVLGVNESPGGVGVFGFASAGTAGDFQSGDPTVAGLVGVNRGGGPIIQAFGGKGGNPAPPEVMVLDNAGDLTIAGNLQTGGMPTSIAPTSAGRKVITYAPLQSVRTVEDLGEAQLVGGRAVVGLEPTFASAIDPRHSYLVFITPQGDTNGLYVTQKTAAGFVVREHNGVSNAWFDYRIVAQPYGAVA
ncbi:MAG: hypothetical protein M3007_02430, partial [Candidatus Eremiobacteraeota bacterium]|nr:hypothetical protein [Candidatus Eremiobacteraeota bacterium]